MIHIFLAPGFEEIEALIPLDLLRRAGLDVKLVSINSTREVESSHHVTIVADSILAETDLSNSDAFIIPGGMPGATNLMECQRLLDLIKNRNDGGGLICAICAGPIVLSAAGILIGRKVTCYPGFEKYLPGVKLSTSLVESDENIITGRGPGAAIAFAFTILRRFIAENAVRSLGEKMILFSNDR